MLTDKEFEVLGNLRPHPVRGREWLRPMDFGAWDASHHSNTASRLAERGLVEMKPRGAEKSWTVEQIAARKARFAKNPVKGRRGGPKVYRITDAGLAAYAAEREQRNRK